MERSYQEWLATKTEEDQRVRKMRQEKAIQKAEEDMQVWFVVAVIFC